MRRGREIGSGKVLAAAVELGNKRRLAANRPAPAHLLVTVEINSVTIVVPTVAAGCATIVGAIESPSRMLALGVRSAVVSYSHLKQQRVSPGDRS